MPTDAQNPGKQPDIESVRNRSLITKLATLTRPVRNIFLYSSVYLAVIAMAEAVLVSELLALPLTPAPIVAGLLTFAVYGNDRLADLETDAKTSPARTAFVRRYQNGFYVLAAIAYGLAVALSALGGPISFGLSLLPGMCWILYACDWIPTLPSGTQRLKEVFLLNSTLVAVVWALVIVCLPLTYVGAPASPAVGVVFLFFVLATFVNTEIPNVRDKEGDSEIGVRTLPVVVGVRWTKYILYGITGLTAVLLGVAFVANIINLREAVVLLVSLLFLNGVIFCLNRTENESALTVAAECTRLPAFVVVVFPLLGQ
ncbi:MULTISPECIES: UbiA family prenyltransferase [Haloarcula]|uniref:UbiA family prenyltransferase n=1 Tax=Haloarcula TaxID=2237 RepID=UPI0007BC0D72|nr:MULTISPECIES: UbiA family prenyltransferase [Haloarcula]KAA9404371.1 4-hydroxybenzoate polyprenyltransferase [Haloarcula sp. CBA1131]KZX46549.1 4-hydroxybenzoate polyprenyltransferase [Haloarcula sp. K1]MUV49333.1 4-hydroxybenzoate polyprenyltransferase [Haloarcula sp. CBA1122]